MARQGIPVVLIERGHQHIAFVGGPMTTVQVADRLHGARNALQTAGLDGDSLVVLAAVRR